MQGFVARQAGRLVMGIVAAALIAAAIAAIGEPYARNLPGFLSAFVRHLGQFGRLDLGTSAVSGAPAADELAAHLPPTVFLVALGAGIAALVGVPLGLIVALGPVRRVVSPLIQVITATPVFCSGLALAFVAVHLLHWPVSVNAPVAAASSQDLLHLTVLPVLTIGLAGAAAVQLALRRATAESSGQAFRNGLKRMGLGAVEIETLYVLPRIVALLLQEAGEILLALLSATVVAEWVFHRDGAADLFVKSVALADWNMAALLLFVFAVAAFVVNFLGRLAAEVLAPGERP